MRLFNTYWLKSISLPHMYFIEVIILSFQVTMLTTSSQWKRSTACITWVDLNFHLTFITLKLTYHLCTQYPMDTRTVTAVDQKRSNKMNSEWNKVQGYRIVHKLEEQMYTKNFWLQCKWVKSASQFQFPTAGILRWGSIGFQDKFQPSYSHYISAKDCVTDFQSALKGSSTLVNYYGFLVDHAHSSHEAVYWLTMPLLLILITH